MGEKSSDKEAFRNLCCRYSCDYSSENAPLTRKRQREKEKKRGGGGGSQREKHRVKDNVWEMQWNEAEQIK